MKSATLFILHYWYRNTIESPKLDGKMSSENIHWRFTTPYLNPILKINVYWYTGESTELLPHPASMILGWCATLSTSIVKFITLHWFSKASDMLCQLDLICLIQRPDYCPPWRLLVATSSATEKEFNHSFKASLVRDMLSLYVIHFRWEIGIYMFTQCTPAPYIPHSIKYVVQRERWCWRERER